MQQPNMQCMSCERMDMQSHASFFCVTCSEFLCDICRKYHLSNKFTSDHDIKPLSDINLEKPLPKPYIGKCIKHKGKILEFFCVDHEVTCCSTCVSIEHRKCEEVVSLEDAVHNFLSDNNDEKIEGDLVAFEKDMETISLHNKKSLEKLDVQYKERVSTMEEVFKDLLNTVEEFGTKRKSELEVLFNEKKDDVNANNVLLENNLTAIWKDKDVLNTSKAEASNIEFMLEAIQIRNRAKEYKRAVSEMAGKYSVDLEVTLNSTDDVEKVKTYLDTLFRVGVKSKMSDLELVSQQMKEMIFEMNRLRGPYSRWQIAPKQSVNTVGFSVSRAISLVGVLSYGTYDSNEDALITVSVDNVILAETRRVLNARDGDDNGLLQVEFPYLVPLKPDTKYLVDFQLDGDVNIGVQFNYGNDGEATIESEGVEFKFENVLTATQLLKKDRYRDSCLNSTEFYTRMNMIIYKCVNVQEP